jgi:hypothetical protein
MTNGRKSLSIGRVPWTKAELKRSAIQFESIYEERPIKDNEGGMKSQSLFFVWFLLRKLKPEAVIESGVWKGQGTWFIEKAVPGAKIFSIDPNLNRIDYKSKRATYSTKDFANNDWPYLPKERTLIIFDDHQDAIKRVRVAQRMGFKHILFDDNYPSGVGDTYSLKKALMMSGHKFKPFYTNLKLKDSLIIFKTYLTQLINGSFVDPNKKDASYLKKALRIYYEFSPLCYVKLK